MPFKIARDGNSYSEHLNARGIFQRVRVHAKKWGPKHRLKGPGEGWQRASRLPWAITRLATRMAKLDEGQIIHLAHGTDRRRKGTERKHEGEVVYRIKRVPKPQPEMPLVRPPWSGLLDNVNPRISNVAYSAYGWSNKVACLGTQNCRRVSGSSVWSQHAFGNAIDLAIRKPPPVGFDLPVQDYLASYLVEHYEELDLAHVIHRDRVWTRGYGWSRYLGTYHLHVHVDCFPMNYGTPECA